MLANANQVFGAPRHRALERHVLKSITTALLLAVGFAASGGPASALQTMVTQVDKNADGSMTYHFAIKTDAGETLSAGTSKDDADFFTVYNFYGYIAGSAKSPANWEVTSEDFGRTPTFNGYPLVQPVDVPGTPNLTWIVRKAVPAGTLVDGFVATTRVSTMVQGEYTAQVSRDAAAVKGAAEAPPFTTGETKQAVIGLLPMPTFLAPAK